MSLFCLVGTALLSMAQSPGNALSFDGSNDYVSAPLAALFADLSNNDFTFETWVKPTGSGTQRIFFAQSTSTTFCSVLLSTSNVPYVFVSRNSILSSVNTQTSLPLNQWSHLACTWDASAASIEVYINGVQTVNISGGSSSVGTDNVMTIGSRSDGSQVLNGEMDEVRIWNDVRTICEIGGSMNSEFSAAQPNLIAYYTFNQGVAAGANAGVNTLAEFTTIYTGNLNNFGLSGSTSNWINSGAVINQLNQNQGVVYGVDVQNSCGPFVWVDGITYTSSNNSATFSYPGGSMAGCDSVATLDLTISSPTSGVDALTACESYTWIDGITYTASNTSATFTLQNSVGCDSIVTLDLTINTSSAGTDVISACDSYTWIDGITYTSSNTSATFTLQNSAGCDSIVSLDLTINTVSAGIVDNSPTLIADPSGAVYQWIDCDNGNAPIAGETSESFTATTNGNYAVIVTQNGCSDTSACVEVANVGLEEIESSKMIRLYPNPNNGTFTLEIESSEVFETIKIVDPIGKEVARMLPKHGITAVDIDVSPGIYFLVTDKTTLQFVIE